MFNNDGDACFTHHTTVVSWVTVSLTKGEAGGGMGGGGGGGGGGGRGNSMTKQRGDETLVCVHYTSLVRPLVCTHVKAACGRCTQRT